MSKIWEVLSSLQDGPLPYTTLLAGAVITVVSLEIQNPNELFAHYGLAIMVYSIFTSSWRVFIKDIRLVLGEPYPSIIYFVGHLIALWVLIEVLQLFTYTFLRE